MSVEERISATVGDIDVGHGDLRTVLEMSHRRRTRVRTTAAGVSVMAILVGLSLAATGLGSRSPAPATRPGPAGTWHQAADFPLAPRFRPLVVWTGHEVIVTGGVTYDPPGASLSPTERRSLDASALESAAYDPATGAWRTLADAPFDFDSDDTASYTMVGDDLVAFASNRADYRYDVSADRWSRLPAPPVPTSNEVVTVGDFAYTLTEHGQVLRLSPSTGEWTMLPPLPSPPSMPGGRLLGGASLIAVGQAAAESTPVDATDTFELTGATWRPVASGTATFLTGGSGVSARHGDHVVTLGAGYVADLAAGPDDTDTWRLGATDLDLTTGANTSAVLPPTLDVDGLDPDHVDYPMAAGDEMVAAYGVVHDLTDDSWVDLATPWAPSTVGVTAVWAGHQLVVVGGLHGQSPVGDTWTWTPPTNPASPRATATDTNTNTNTNTNRQDAPPAVALTVRPSTVRPGRRATLTTAPGVWHSDSWVMSREPSARPAVGPAYQLEAAVTREIRRPGSTDGAGVVPLSRSTGTSVTVPDTAGPGTWWVCADGGPRMCASLVVLPG